MSDDPLIVTYMVSYTQKDGTQGQERFTQRPGCMVFASYLENDPDTHEVEVWVRVGRWNATEQ